MAVETEPVKGMRFTVYSDSRVHIFHITSVRSGRVYYTTADRWDAGRTRQTGDLAVADWQNLAGETWLHGEEVTA